MTDNGDGTYSVLVTLRSADCDVTVWLDMSVVDGVPVVVDYDVVRVRVSDAARRAIIADYLRARRKPRKEYDYDGSCV